MPPITGLTEDESRLFRSLSTQLGNDARQYERLDHYYEGWQRLEQLGLAVPEELRRFVTLVNWPRITVDSLEERIDLEGFRLPGEDDRDEDLWAVWQGNGLDEESQLGHLDTLTFGRAGICVGATSPDDPDPDHPLVTVESPQDLTWELDPRTRVPRAALRRSSDDKTAAPATSSATLYLPDVTVWLERNRDTGSRWAEVDRDAHGMGRVPVVPLVNRPRLKRRRGVSEMADVITLTDAAARALTNAQVATEVLAVPQRYALGMSKGDFVDKDGRPLPTWEAYFGAVWATSNPDAKVGQFEAAQLANFSEIVNHYAQLVAGLTGLPVRFFGQNAANPPSAEGIRADEARIVKRAERRQRAWGGSWETAMRIVRRIQDGQWLPELARMETLWRDAATPTRAQQADAVSKLVDSGILPVEAAWEDLGYSSTRRAKLRAMRAAESSDPLMERVMRDVAPVTGEPEPEATPVLNGAGAGAGRG